MTKSFKRKLASITARKRALAALLGDERLKAVLAALALEGEETRIIGGAVRDLLCGLPLGDVDLATTLEPQAVMGAALAAGLKAVPTGFDHGTVTLVSGGKPFEVTTLRKDVETDGRHAVVAFSKDFVEDAGRRDFTFNALSLDANGVLHDPFGGVEDLKNGIVRFIGDPGMRMQEDYLRILRFFRFYAGFGHGQPDRAAMLAIVANREGLTRLSAERVWAELTKLLSVEDPLRALRWMRQVGAYQIVLPESSDMDAAESVLALERDLFAAPDPLRRLMALLQPQIDRVQALAKRLKLSARESGRLRGFVAGMALDPFRREDDLYSLVHRLPPDGWRDTILIAGARAQRIQGLDLVDIRMMLDRAERLSGAVFPVRAGDLMVLGHEPGPALGQLLKTLEDLWVESGFTLSQADLLESLADD